MVIFTEVTENECIVHRHLRYKIHFAIQSSPVFFERRSLETSREFHVLLLTLGTSSRSIFFLKPALGA